MELYYINESEVRYADAADEPCVACCNAGVETGAMGPVWELSAQSWEDGRWSQGNLDYICESCLLDEGVFAFAENAEQAFDLARRWDANEIQEDNVVFQGRTVGALQR